MLSVFDHLLLYAETAKTINEGKDGTNVHWTTAGGCINYCDAKFPVLEGTCLYLHRHLHHLHFVMSVSFRFVFFKFDPFPSHTPFAICVFSPATRRYFSTPLRFGREHASGSGFFLVSRVAV